MIQWLRCHKEFLFVLIAGLLLRFYFVSTNGLSNDELSAWLRTDYDSFSELIQLGIKENDMHPIFYQSLLWQWLSWFGQSEFSIRALSIAFYVGDLVLIYVIGKKYFSKTSAILTICFFSFLGFSLLNTTFSRPYASGTFFLLLALYSLLNISSSSSNKQKWSFTFLLSIGFTGAILSHYFCVFPVAFLGVFGLYKSRFSEWKYLIVAGVITVFGFLSNWSITSFHLSQGGLGWLDKPEWDWIFTFLFQLFNSSWILISGTLTFLIWARWQKRITISSNAWMSLWIFLGVVIVGMMVSLLYTPVMREPAMLFILPFLFLYVFSVVDLSFLSEMRFFLVVILTSIGLVVNTIYFFDLSPSKHYADFRQQAQFIAENQDEDVHVVSMTNNVAYLNFYLDDKLVEKEKDWDDGEAIYRLSERVRDAKRANLMYVVNYPSNTVMHEEIIKRYFPSIKKNLITDYSAVFVFDTLQNRTAKTLMNTMEGIDSKDEFFGEIILNSGSLKHEHNKYYVLETERYSNLEEELYWVVSLEEEGQMKMKGDQPEYYRAFNQLKLNDPEQKMFMAFSLPRELKENERLKIYLWNPRKEKVKTGKIKLYESKRYH
ncbi:MAG: hypothetical protein EP305_01095 [Bacteroidetes bacterium]|nr:MAG: hypothetical protein EP305_01095 [Bacteroidota bacterium]